MQVINKLDSIRLIKENHLNSFPEQLFCTGQEEQVAAFLDKYPALYYAVRSKEIVGCRFNNFKVLREKVLEEIKKFHLFAINVSSYNYIEHLLFIGDVFIGRNNEVWLIGTTNKNYTGKMAERDPEFNYKTDIFDKKLDKVLGFDKIYGYIVQHQLLDVIVELALYDKRLGTEEEFVIVFEIRTDF